MRQTYKMALVAAVMATSLGATPNDAMARTRLYPLTRCGPDLAYLCPIHGYFDQAPFHYHLAIFPGCIKMQSTETPSGIRRLPVLVCG
jgi:hypothetical protein